MRLTGRFTERRALVITLCWVVALAAIGSTDVLLFLTPALLIAVPLFCGRYFGEELIVRLAQRQARKPRRSHSGLPSTPCPPALWRPRGTHLLAFSLDKRPPPLPLPAQI